MDKNRLQHLAGVKQLNEEHGNMDLFQDSLRIVFGLSDEVIESLISMVRRHGETMQIRDQQVRRRAGPRATKLLKQAHAAAGTEGDVHYDEEMPDEEMPTDTEDDFDPIAQKNADERYGPIDDTEEVKDGQQ